MKIKSQTFTKNLLCLVMSAALSGCAMLSGFGKDNTPPPAALTEFTPSKQFIQLWSAQTTSGTQDRGLLLTPAIQNAVVYTVGARGEISANKVDTGQTLWRTTAKKALTTGPAVAKNVLLVGGGDSQLLAFNAKTGEPLWQRELPNEMLAPPAINQGTAVAKTLNDDVVGLVAGTGEIRWQQAHGAPDLILRGASTPLIEGSHVYVGFADGQLQALNLTTGNVLWQQQIASPKGTFPVQRLVDIVATPVIDKGVIYAATYQGQIAALTMRGSSRIWEHKLSSYTGLCVGQTAVFVTDASSSIWAFDKSNGQVLWRQTVLHDRGLTAPACLPDAIVVGDEEGYLHALAKNDGHLLARLNVGSGAFASKPQLSNETLIANTKTGNVIAFKLKPL